ncbi:MAG: MarR family winged helix-turn-helix transcriptional regulator [Parvularculaceae bacterium]
MNASLAASKLVDPLETNLGYQLRRLSAAAMADLSARLASSGVKPSEATVLLFIQANPETTQSAVGRRLSIQRANMAPIIAALEERNLIRRTPLNGRSFGLACTRTGATFAEKLKKSVASHEAAFFGALDGKERERLIRTIAALRNAVEGEPDDA